MAEPHEHSGAVVSARGLVVRRSGRAILDGVEIVVPKGPPFAISGRSGSGKTTLLMALSGLRPADEGTVRIDATDIQALSPRERARRVGLVFQEHQLFPHLTAHANVTLAPRLAGRSDIEHTCEMLFKELGISELGARRPHELSGGQRQRVAIARALALSPVVMLLDEPTASLDAQTTRDLSALLRRLEERTQVVVVSHDLPFIEQCCSRGVRLEEGRVAACGSLTEILER